MANKKINQLGVRSPLSLTDLMLVGDPSTGYSYKTTIGDLSTFFESNIALNDLSDVTISSPANGNLLAYNGTQWVNRTLGAFLGGTVGQYVRGDGTLGDFSGGGGGGGASVSYYLNGSVNQGTIGGVTYLEMNKNPIIGAGTDFTRNTNGYIASFLTDANDPALLKIPAGNWNLEFYFSASSGGGTPTFYVELYKYDGSTFTLIASNSTTPEVITGGTVIDAYFTTLSVPETVLTLTDRLAIRVYTTTVGRTITLHTENSHLCQVITTFTTGLTALNNLTAQVQFFATGTTGSDFNISSTTETHTFNIPTASGTNRGALSSADWTTFNGKVGGSGTTNYVPKFTASGTIGNSQIFDNGTNVGIGTASPSAKLDVTAANGEIRSTGTAAAYTQYNAFITSGVNMRIGAYATSNGYLGTTTNHPFTIETNNTQRARFFANGNLLIGSGTTDGGYLVDISGTTRISGTELRLDNATTGTINLYSNTPRVNFFSGGGYSIGRNGTAVELISGGSIAFYIGANQGYSLTAANGHIWYSAISGSAALGRFTTGGNLIVGGTTDAGFKFDVIGTSRLNGNVTIGASTLILSNQEANQILRITAPIGIQISSDKWISITSSSSYIQNGFTTKNFVSTTQSNGNFNSFDFSNSNSYTPTIANIYTQKLMNGAMTINSTAAGNNFHGVSISTTDNSASIANNVFAVYADATLGTNTSATRWAGYFVGRISNTLGATFATSSGNVLIGTTTDAGYKLDVNGTARVSGMTTIATSTANTESLVITNSATGGGSPYLKLGVWATLGQTFSSQYTIIGNNCYPTNGASSTWTRINAAKNASFININYDAIVFGSSINAASGSLETGGMYLVSNSLGIGIATPNASALLHLSSTTKGFLMPSMTGANAEAITTPATGLLVYANNGNGTTITSTGWWGYDGTTWVKLN
jgi:hypothetical protein